MILRHRVFTLSQVRIIHDLILVLLSLGAGTIVIAVHKVAAIYYLCCINFFRIKAVRKSIHAICILCLHLKGIGASETFIATTGISQVNRYCSAVSIQSI